MLPGDNTCGKTSVLSAIAVGLGVIPKLLPDVSGIGFLKNDRRRHASFVRVALTATDGVVWHRRMVHRSQPVESTNKYRRLVGLQEKLDSIVHMDRERRAVDLPIVAFYKTERAVLDSWKRRASVPREMTRYAALDGALSARTSFRELFHWFYAREYEELREQKKRGNFAYQRKDLVAVRNAISSMLHSVSNPRIEFRPLRLSVSAKLENGDVETLEIDQLSDGQRAVLALAADLAWRMALGNPHLKEPLSSEAIVLIDEVELHLHPSWQQRILRDLHRTFPNAQFIVSTHSPQVLTTVKPEHVVELARKNGRIVAGSAAGWTYGAEAGDVLKAVMGVDERPENDFTRKLADYRRLVSDGQGESGEAQAIRAALESLSPDDPVLARADLEIRQRRLFKQMAKS